MEDWYEETFLEYTFVLQKKKSINKLSAQKYEKLQNKLNQWLNNSE